MSGVQTHQLVHEHSRGNWLVKSPGGEFLITHQEVELAVPYKRRTLGWVIEKKNDSSAVHICETAEEMRDYILSASR